MNKQLPERSNLEQLKKQAKSLLENVRASQAEALGRIGQENRETFALHDAQRILAREYGFTSWLKLKLHLKTQAIGPMVPLLNVYDMRRTVAFYRDVLGFELEQQWEPDGHLYWASMKRGGTKLMFNAEYEDHERKPEHDRPHQDVIFYFYPQDVVGLRESLIAHGCKVSALQVVHYNHKQFEVKDPDGYRLCFSQPTTELPPDTLQ